jgi:uncharacterized protein (TIGR00251 family)
LVINLRVTPRSSSDELAGWQGDELRVRLRAAPVDGQANEALLRFLAGRLGLALRDVALVSGTASRSKRVRVEGIDAEELRRRLLLA